MAKNVDFRVLILLACFVALGRLFKSPTPSIYVLICKVETISSATFQGFNGRPLKDLAYSGHFWLLFTPQEPWAPLLLMSSWPHLWMCNGIPD